MKRLFVFGCSFTNYDWPTWADMLSLEFEYFENWAMPGLGNRAIAERLAECHLRNTITKDDVVIIQWSSHIRQDWYKDIFNTEENSTEGWAVHYTSKYYIEHKAYIDKIFSEKSSVLHTLNMIVLAQQLLSSTECTWLMTSLGDIRNLGYDNVFNKRGGVTFVDDETKELAKDRTDWLIWKKFPDFKIYEKLWNNDKWVEPLFKTVKENKNRIWRFEKNNYVDLHPTPFMHNQWLNQKLKPKLNIEYNHDTSREFIASKFQLLKDSGRYSIEEFFDLVDALLMRIINEKKIALPNKHKPIGF
jgi:hypothetical protein